MRPHPTPGSVSHNKSGGFTLVELLISISIVAILAAMLLAASGRMKATTDASACLANLRQISLAAGLYAADNQGELPPAAFVNMLMPYTEDRSAVFWCPRDSRSRAWKTAGTKAGASATSYGYNADLIGLATQANRWGTQCWVRARTLPLEIEKPSTKILFLDGSNYYVRRMNPNAAFRHEGGLNIAYVDGHVAPFTGTEEDLYKDANWVAAE